MFTETGGDDGKTWSYTLRFNSSVVPSTDTEVDIFTRSNEALWLDEGIMAFAIEQEYGDSEVYESRMSELKAKTSEYSKGVFQFASYPYKQDNFWAIAGGLFGFFLFIMFSYPLVTVISILVEEKRSKIKEGMKVGSHCIVHNSALTVSFPDDGRHDVGVLDELEHVVLH